MTHATAAWLRSEAELYGQKARSASLDASPTRNPGSTDQDRCRAQGRADAYRLVSGRLFRLAEEAEMEAIAAEEAEAEEAA